MRALLLVLFLSSCSPSIELAGAWGGGGDAETAQAAYVNWSF